MEVSHSCEPVPNVLPNARPHEWEHSDSQKTVPAARENPPERLNPYPTARHRRLALDASVRQRAILHGRKTACAVAADGEGGAARRIGHARPQVAPL